MTVASTVVPFVDLKAQYQTIRDEIRAAVDTVFESTQFILGDAVETFERAFASYLGVKHAIGVGSGVDALKIALEAAGVGPGDEVIISDPTFGVYEANRDLSRARTLPWFAEYALPNVLANFEPDPTRHGSYHFDWTTADEIAKYREALQDGNPAELWEARGEELWKKPQGPKQVSLASCDLGLGPGVVKGAYAQLPRYFPDAKRVMDLETRLVWCMVNQQGYALADAMKVEYEGIVGYSRVVRAGAHVWVAGCTGITEDGVIAGPGLLRAGAEGVGIGQHGVDLPLFAGRAGDPDLVLGGEATRGADLLLGEQARPGEPGDLGVHQLAGLDFHAEGVDGAAGAGVLQQHQLQRRLGDGEVGIARLDLGRGGVKQLGVERDRRIEIIDVERELNTGHDGLLNV